MRAIRYALFSIVLTACSSEAPKPAPPGAQEIAIQVDGTGYHPAELKGEAGKPVRLVFKRTSDDGCGQQVVFPDLKIRKDLPLGMDVPVDVTMPASGKVAFTCGMGMYKGAVVVQ